MTATRPLFAAVVAAFVSGCFSASMPPDYPAVVRAADAPSSSPWSASTANATVEQDEATLPKEARLDVITHVALARSPIVKEARARTQAALARVKGTGRLPDLEFKYEMWGHPIGRWWALNETQMHMFGLRQTFPALGSLDAQTKIAFEEAKVALELQHARELDVIADVRKAWTAYRAAVRETAIHVEHVQLNEKLFELAKVQLQVGKGGQSDVLRIQLEVTRVHTEIIALGTQLTTSRARLNTLMARELEAPLGPPPDVEFTDVSPRMDDLKAMVAKRPELAAADAEVHKNEAAVAGAKSEAKNPMVMVGLDYQLMPMTPHPHNIGAMIQFSLPWLSGRRADEVKAAEASAQASKSARAALESVILLQVREALARYEAAKSRYAIIDGQLLPQARKAFDATQAAWAAGGGDSLGVVDGLRTYLQIQIERSRALADVELAVADIERAIGGPLPTKGAKK